MSHRQDSHVHAARSAMGISRDLSSASSSASRLFSSSDTHSIAESTMSGIKYPVRVGTRPHRDPERDSFLRGGTQFHSFKRPEKDTGYNRFVQAFKRKLVPGSLARTRSARTLRADSSPFDTTAPLNYSSSLRSAQSTRSHSTPVTAKIPLPGSRRTTISSSRTPSTNPPPSYRSTTNRSHAYHARSTSNFSFATAASSLDDQWRPDSVSCIVEPPIAVTEEVDPLDLLGITVSEAEKAWQSEQEKNMKASPIKLARKPPIEALSPKKRDLDPEMSPIRVALDRLASAALFDETLNEWSSSLTATLSNMSKIAEEEECVGSHCGNSTTSSDAHRITVEQYMRAHSQPRPLFVVNPDETRRSLSTSTHSFTGCAGGPENELDPAFDTIFEEDSILSSTRKMPDETRELHYSALPDNTKPATTVLPLQPLVNRNATSSLSLKATHFLRNESSTSLVPKTKEQRNFSNELADQRMLAQRSTSQRVHAQSREDLLSQQPTQQPQRRYGSNVTRGGVRALTQQFEARVASTSSTASSRYIPQARLPGGKGRREVSDGRLAAAVERKYGPVHPVDNC